MEWWWLVVGLVLLQVLFRVPYGVFGWLTTPSPKNRIFDEDGNVKEE